MCLRKHNTYQNRKQSWTHKNKPLGLVYQNNDDEEFTATFIFKKEAENAATALKEPKTAKSFEKMPPKESYPLAKEPKKSDTDLIGLLHKRTQGKTKFN